MMQDNDRHLPCSMRCERNRLATFSNFPCSEFVSTLRLAQSGYYYTGNDSNCQCYLCGYEHCEWTSGVIPLHCELRSTGTVENIPIHRSQHAQDRLVPSAQPSASSYYHCPSSHSEEPKVHFESVHAHLLSATSRGVSSNTNDRDRSGLFRMLRLPINSSSAPQLPSVDNIPKHSTQRLCMRLRNEQTGRIESSAPSETNGTECTSRRHLLPRIPSGCRRVVSTPHRDSPPTNQCKIPDNSESWDCARGAVSMCPSGSRRPLSESDTWLPVPEENFRLSTAVRSTPGIPQTHRERLSTFHYWPSSLPTAQKMAVAGFFYLGYGDSVQCSFCNGRLRDWSAMDDPWSKHARKFPHCKFILQHLTKISGNQGQTDVSCDRPDDICITDAQIASMSATRELQNLSFELPDIVNACRELNTVDLRVVTQRDILKYFYEDTEEDRFSTDDRCLCCVCSLQVVSLLFFPCRHGCCTECKGRQLLHHCPRCDHHIKAKINVFI